MDIRARSVSFCDHMADSGCSQRKTKPRTPFRWFQFRFNPHDASQSGAFTQAPAALDRVQCQTVGAMRGAIAKEFNDRGIPPPRVAANEHSLRLMRLLDRLGL
jgi:hypothetical protein